jgi:anti-sigma-K factor RskA
MPGGAVTEPTAPDLMTLATPYALHAVSETEYDDIERQLTTAPELVVRAFADEVRAVRETMAVVSSATAIEPPDGLRERLLAAVNDHAAVRQLNPPQRRNWRSIVMSAAAALVVGLTVVGIGWAIRPEPKPTMAEQIFAASDVRTVSGAIPTGGTATVVFSRQRNAVVLVMNNVAPPQTGTVYQMWLVAGPAQPPRSAGTMDAAAVAPSTTAVLPDLGDSKALAFTVEPGGGSSQPTSPVFAELPLT